MSFIRSLIKVDQQEMKMKKNEILFNKVKKSTQFFNSDFANLSNFSKKVNNLKSMTKYNNRSLSMNTKELRKYSDVDIKKSPINKFNLNGKPFKIPIETFTLSLRHDFSHKKLEIPSAFRTSLYNESNEKQDQDVNPKSRAFYLTKVDEKLKDECTQTKEDVNTDYQDVRIDDSEELSQRKYSYQEQRLPFLQTVNIPRRRSEVKLSNNYYC